MSNPYPDHTLIFMHIPKAGGMSMRQVMARQVIGQPAYLFNTLNTYSIDRFVEKPQAERDALRYVGGHIQFGVHRFINNPSVYVTMFRDPREHLISFYYFFRKTPSAWAYDLIKDKSFEEFLQMRRMQTIQLNYTVGFDEEPHPEHGGIGAKRNYSLPVEERIALAEQNIRQHYGAIGLTDRFDESMVIMRQRMGWKNVHYLYKHYNKGRPRGEETGDIKAMVEHYAQPDIQFYERMKAIYAEQRAAYGPTLATDLRTYQRNKAIYNRIAGMSQSLRETGIYRRLRVMSANRSS